MANEKISRMKQINEILSKAADAYYNTSDTIMTDAEYDRLYAELEKLEEETGVILGGSRTQNVGFEVSSYLPKVQHPHRMLSLDKTKDREQLAQWLGSHDGLLSWKLDGLTVCLYYEDGKLDRAVSRGNGEVGEDLTANARHIKGIPARIPFKGHLALRGEALIGYKDFERVNESLSEGEQAYKNPRNLASGTLRSLDSKIVAERNVNFFAFALTEADNYDDNSFANSLDWLESLGFQRVYGELVNAQNVVEAVGRFEKNIAQNDFPSDGLVLVYDDIEYGKSLGETVHHPKNGIAFKWADEKAETTLREIIWSPSRTGLINPIAVFDTVELEGTSVSRASVHNISILKKLDLAVGDTISVYKANMIIPVIDANLSAAEHTCEMASSMIPEKCPACGGDAVINRSDDGIETLFCTNEECSAKHEGRFEHFVQRDAMNIAGLASSTIKTFIENGFLHDLSDFYHLERHKDKIISLEGFGERSYSQIISAVEASRNTELYRVLYSLGIPNIGRAASRLICARYKDPEKLIALTHDELTQIDGIGDVLADEYVDYFADNSNAESFRRLLSELNIAKDNDDEAENASPIAGKTFVITGAVHIFKNRSELKERIESLGAKTASAVSSKTDYLINNDSTSTSSKNKKANELNIPIITEEEFMDMIK